MRLLSNRSCTVILLRWLKVRGIRVAGKGGRAARGLSEAAEALLGMGFADDEDAMVRFDIS